MLALYLSLLDEQENQRKFQWIYEHLRHPMYRVALSLLHDRERAQDAVQESFFKVIRNFSKISSLSAEEITPYIVTIAENTAKDMLRKERPAEELPPEWAPPAPESPHSQAMYQRLVELILAMPEQYRHILLLKFVEEQSDAAIARRLGLSVSQVSNRVSRGRRLLQEILRKEGYTP